MKVLFSVVGGLLMGVMFGPVILWLIKLGWGLVGKRRRKDGFDRG